MLFLWDDNPSLKWNINTYIFNTMLLELDLISLKFDPTVKPHTAWTALPSHVWISIFSTNCPPQMYLTTLCGHFHRLCTEDLATRFALLHLVPPSAMNGGETLNLKIQYLYESLPAPRNVCLYLLAAPHSGLKVFICKFILWPAGWLQSLFQ